MQGIPSRALATPEQWTVIQAYGLSLQPLASNGRGALWHQDSISGLRFTECYDYLLRDIAKKHSRTLARLGVALLLAVPAAPALPANNRKFRTLIVHINLHVKVLIWCWRFGRPTQRPPLDRKAICLPQRQHTPSRAGTSRMEETFGPHLAGAD